MGGEAQNRVVRGDGEEVEYYEVWDEPLHERRLEVVGVVRCYEARIGPGQSTAWHRHEEDCLYVSLAACEAWNEPVDREGVLHVAAEGDVFCRHTRTEAAPYIHRVACKGGSDCRFFGIECLLPPPPPNEEDQDNDEREHEAESDGEVPAGIAEVKVEKDAGAGPPQVDREVSITRSFASVAGTFGAASSDDPFITARFGDCVKRVDEGCTGRFECYRIRLAPGGATPPLYWFRPGVLVSLGAFEGLSSEQVGVLGLGVPLSEGPVGAEDAGVCWAHKGGGGVARLRNEGGRLVRALLVLLR